MNYTELVAAIEDACENTFTEPNMTRMIHAGEKKIYNAVNFLVSRKTASLVTVSGNRFVTLPDDFLSADSLAVSTNLSTAAYTYLLNKEPDFIREGYPNPSTTGVPAHYALYDEDLQIVLGPTPNAVFALQLQYYGYPESIVTADTTWLGDNFDFVLFDGCMIEAGLMLRYVKDDMAVLENKFAQSLALLKNYGNGKLEQDTYRSGNARVKVV